MSTQGQQAEPLPSASFSVELRPYQRDGLRRIEASWQAGNRRVLAVAPTGSGKGTMAVELMARAVAKKQRVLFVVHLREIAEDIAQRARNRGLCVGMILPGHARDAKAPVQVASIQSLLGSIIRKYDLVIIDEAHHYRADEWEKIVGSIGKARVAGFTATPQRADGKGLGKVFDDLIEVARYNDLLARGEVVPCRVFAPPVKLKKGTGMEPAAAYLKHAKGRSAFVYVRDLSGASAVLKKLRRAGISAEIVSNDTPHDERADHVARLKSGDLKVIVNYATMTEGVDAPIVSCVVIEQSCVFWGAYAQRIGRCIRPHPGKEDALVIDLAGAAYRHGLIGDDHRVFTLDLCDPVKLSDNVSSRTWRSRAFDFSSGNTGLIEVSREWLADNGGPRYVDWSAVDWTKTVSKISIELGLPSHYVRKMRLQLGIAPSAAVSKVDRLVNEVVDWTKSNLSIAIESGCSDTTVAKARRKMLGAEHGLERWVNR